MTNAAAGRRADEDVRSGERFFEVIKRIQQNPVLSQIADIKPAVMHVRKMSVRASLANGMDTAAAVLVNAGQFEGNTIFIQFKGRDTATGIV